VAAKLDNRNVRQYEYTNSKGEQISIREDKAANYKEGGKGDQTRHFNAGSKDADNLKQHHNFP
jgi:predicted alpha/beta superfamily hydrolase